MCAEYNKLLTQHPLHFMAPNNMSRASEFFEYIVKANDPSGIMKAFIDDRKSESEFLEFKGASNILDNQAKEMWSELLSAFANTEGGVVVWGIRAAKITDPSDPSNKIDVATNYDLVPQPGRFAQMLKDVRLEATIDPVSGVEVHPIDSREGQGGYVVCYIPESRYKPHRAQLPKSRQYYHRIGDSTVILSHSILRSLFFPKSSPSLIIKGFTCEEYKDGVQMASIRCTVANMGHSTAREVYVASRFMLDCELEYSTPHSPPSLSKINKSNKHLTFILQQSLHPAQERWLFTLRYSKNPISRNWKPGFGNVSIDIQFYMLDQSPQGHCLNVDFDNLGICEELYFEPKLDSPA